MRGGGDRELLRHAELALRALAQTARSGRYEDDLIPGVEIHREPVGSPDAKPALPTRGSIGYCATRAAEGAQAGSVSASIRPLLRDLVVREVHGCVQFIVDLAVARKREDPDSDDLEAAIRGLLTMRDRYPTLRRGLVERALAGCETDSLSPDVVDELWLAAWESKDIAWLEMLLDTGVPPAPNWRLPVPEASTDWGAALHAWKAEFETTIALRNFGRRGEGAHPKRERAL